MHHSAMSFHYAVRTANDGTLFGAPWWAWLILIFLVVVFVVLFAGVRRWFR